MATSLHGSSQKASDSLESDNQDGVTSFGSETNIGLTFHITEGREMYSAVSHSMGRPFRGPVRTRRARSNTVNDLIEELDNLTLLNRTKEQIALDPFFTGVDVEFKNFIPDADKPGHQIPVVDLEDVRGDNMIPSYEYFFKDFSFDAEAYGILPSAVLNKAAPKPLSNGNFGDISPRNNNLSPVDITFPAPLDHHEDGVTPAHVPTHEDHQLSQNSVDRVLATLQTVINEETSDGFLASHSTRLPEQSVPSACSPRPTDPSPLPESSTSFEQDAPFFDYNSTHSTAANHPSFPESNTSNEPSSAPSFDLNSTHSTVNDHPPLPESGPSSDLAAAPSSNFSSNHLIATDHLPLPDLSTTYEQATGSSFNFGPYHAQATTFDLVPPTDNSLSQALGGPSSEYRFPETPARTSLPFPIEPSAVPPISPNQPDFEALGDRESLNQTHGNHWFEDSLFSIGQSSEGSLSSRWSIPPSLSPSFTESSQDSTLYTPRNGQSPTSMSFSSPEARFSSLAFLHTLPSQEVIGNISYADDNLPSLSFDNIQFGDTFAPYEHPQVPRHRTTFKAAEVHEEVMAQVAPYPIVEITPRPTPKAKKGKAKAKDTDDDDDNGKVKVPKKGKKKRDEADKVRCEVEGCDGTFFSNWELRRHQKNLHGMGIGNQSQVATCPMCGKRFQSMRKDSVDRHIQKKACGKRNPRKTRDRIYVEQT